MGPTFSCIGTYRAGTTWLYTVLYKHPDIYLPNEKELMFFSHHYEKGISWYEKFFDQAKDHQGRGDITPAYLSYREAPALIAKNYPDIKLIVSLRNPVDQIDSLYQLWLTRNYTDRDLKTALETEDELLDNVLYHKHISDYLEHFNRDQILVLLYDELKDNPKEFLKKVYNFLEVDEFFPEEAFKKQNAYRSPKSKILERFISGTGDLLRQMKLLKFKSILNKTGISEKIKKINTSSKKKDTMPEDVRQRINQHVSEDIKKLEELLNIKLSTWN